MRPPSNCPTLKPSVKASASATDQISSIKSAILSYVNSPIRTEGFKVGVDVSPFEISQTVAQKSSCFVVSCLVTKQTVDDLQPVTIPLEIWEKAVTSESLIEVVLA